MLPVSKRKDVKTLLVEKDGNSLSFTSRVHLNLPVQYGTVRRVAIGDFLNRYLEFGYQTALRGRVEDWSVAWATDTAAGVSSGVL